jgi:hypothetical protein
VRAAIGEDVEVGESLGAQPAKSLAVCRCEPEALISASPRIEARRMTISEKFPCSWYTDHCIIRPEARRDAYPSVPCLQRTILLDFSYEKSSLYFPLRFIGHTVEYTVDNRYIDRCKNVDLFCTQLRAQNPGLHILSISLGFQLPNDSAQRKGNSKSKVIQVESGSLYRTALLATASRKKLVFVFSSKFSAHLQCIDGALG